MTTRRKSKGRRCTYWYPGKGRSPEEYALEVAKSRRENEWRHVLWNMPFGSLRRQHLCNLLSTPGERLIVNRRGCIVLDHDSDLRRLLKQGKLVQTRRGIFGSRNTYLVTPSNL